MADEKLDLRVQQFEWWHNAVFGPKPIRYQIPFFVLRAYLDYEVEMSRAKRGIEQNA